MKSCHQVTIAQNSIAHVQCCNHCDCVSVHIGSITLRMDANALEALWAALGEAASALHAKRLLSTHVQQGVA
jgi:hypothetical protein